MTHTRLLPPKEGGQVITFYKTINGTIFKIFVGAIMKKVSLVFIVLFSFSILLRGASPGKIRGVIRDNSGLPLVGVKILGNSEYYLIEITDVKT